MKFKITLKDPDGVYESVRQAAEGSLPEGELSDDEREALMETRMKRLNDIIGKWFEYGEYLTVEVDTETRTISVCLKP